MPFAVDGRDRFRILKHLSLSPDSIPQIESEMEKLRLKSTDLVDMAVGFLDELDGLQNNLDIEMGTNAGSLTKAGPLEWSQNRFIPMLMAKKNKVQGLATLLGLEANLGDIDKLLVSYGYGGNIQGRLLRN